MKDYFETIAFVLTTYLFVSDAIKFYELGELAFDYYSQGVADVAIFLSLILYFRLYR